MIQNRHLLRVVLLPALLSAAVIAAGDDKKPDGKVRSGVVVGVLTDKKPAGGGVLIKADGEETARRYWKFGNQPAVNKEIEAIPIGTRVRVTWEAPGNEGPHIARIEVIRASGEPPKGRPDAKTPSADETLAWLKRVDGELKKPRYADLTREKLLALTELQLGGHRKTDNKHLFVRPAEFRYLTALTGLKKVHLGENDGVTDEALEYVGKLSRLTELILWDAPITDDGLKRLVGLKELTSLDLAFATKLTTAGLEHVVQLQQLERLNIAGTKVDNVAVLTKLLKLKVLRLGKLKPAGVEALKKANPQLVVLQH